MEAIRYYKLFDMINRRGIKKSELASMTGLSSKTMAKLANGDNVEVNVITRICSVLNCQPGDIMEYIPDAEGEGKGVETNATGG